MSTVTAEVNAVTKDQGVSEGIGGVFAQAPVPAKINERQLVAQPLDTIMGLTLGEIESQGQNLLFIFKGILSGAVPKAVLFEYRGFEIVDSLWMKANNILSAIKANSLSDSDLIRFKQSLNELKTQFNQAGSEAFSQIFDSSQNLDFSEIDKNHLLLALLWSQSRAHYLKHAGKEISKRLAS